ncbi:MAG: helix-turn-helix domain-containing protein [Oscillospiraceae bacterium]|nr:helix-turn-helix domain-containing protein [Oscillospiraceae bacterium]
MAAITAKEFSSLYGLSLPIVYRLCSVEGFPAVRFGRTIRIITDDLDTWMKEHTGQDVLGEAAG